ncbi:MAG TPA: PaaI family thioesterase [Caulobacteraceae bacterium]|nr:PaaI family thioesterase [Caulobacteraceae bacterium]
MNQTLLAAIPEGFSRHYRQSPLTEPWEPLYSRRTEAAVEIGLIAAPAHTNSRGFVHGGLIAALADNAMGLTCGLALESVSGLVTVNLAIDYLGTATVGQWLQITPSVVKVGGSLCFAQAIVTADGRPCARANSTFKVAGGAKS